MSSPTTFDLSSVYRSLGVKSAINPVYRTATMSPVAVVADFSSTFSPEAFEGRYWWCMNLNNAGGGAGPISTIDVEIFSRGAGGLVVEHLEALASIATINIAVKRDAAQWGAAAWAAMYGDPIGGTAFLSTCNWVIDLGIPIGASPISIGSNYLLMPTSRLFVPAGSYLRIAVSNTAGVGAFSCQFVIVAREVPETLGAP